MLVMAALARIQPEPARSNPLPRGDVEDALPAVAVRGAGEDPNTCSPRNGELKTRDLAFRLPPDCPTPFTWTTSEDFDQGILINVHHDVADQLQRNALPTPLPYIWVAASGRGTIVMIDTQTGQILGEYHSSPSNHSNNPSRTTVDLDGNMWVANRDDTYCDTGSITKVGLVIGGTRVDAGGSPDENGDYLEPPFDYCNCEDRDGDSLIKTSRGLGFFLDWPNADGADDDGGVDHAEDECIIRHTRVSGIGTRTIAVNTDNDVWVGGNDNNSHEKIDGFSGTPVEDTQFEYWCGGYGGLVDCNDYLWSATDTDYLLRKLTTNPMMLPWCIDIERTAYGLGIDGNGDIWLTNYDFDTVTKLSPMGTILGTFNTGGAIGDRGVAVTPVDNHVWVANSAGSDVSRLDNDGTWLKTIPLGADGLTPTGVAVDGMGKIWATCRNSHTVKRIDPTGGGDGLGEVDLTVDLDPDAWPYNYSDMTGLVALLTSATGTWVVVHDGVEAGAQWHLATWNTEGCAAPHEPPGTSLTVGVRAADTELGLTVLPYLEIENDEPFYGISGRYIQIRVRFKGACPGETFATPVLCDLTVTGDLQSGEDCQPNGIPDECEPDCNSNGTADSCDVPPFCTDPWPDCSLDCNTNMIPDECELTDNDCNSNGIPDDCESDDCNENGVSDFCDVAGDTSPDCNGNDVPDECEVPPLGVGPDCNGDDIPDDCEMTRHTLYAVTSQGPGFYVIDPSDGSCSHIGDMDQDVDEAAGLSAHPQTGELYAAVWIVDGVFRPHTLVTVNPQTAAVNVIGVLAEELSDIAFGDDGTLYGILDSTGEVVTVDTNDGSITSTGCLVSDSPRHSFAFKPGTNLLYHHAYRVCEFHTVIERIDVDTCELSSVGEFCNVTTIVTDCLIFQPNVTDLLASSSSHGGPGQLYATSPTTCDLTLRGSCGVAIAGMAFLPFDNDCNTNMIPDDCDIADETSDDCQPNGIPDECEPDCDGDDIPDDCDVAACCYEDLSYEWICVNSQSMQDCAVLAASGTGEYAWHCTEEDCSQLWPPLPDCGKGACCYNDLGSPPGTTATCEENLDETTCMGRTNFIKWEVNKTCEEIDCYVPPSNDDCEDKETLPGDGAYEFDTEWALTNEPNPTTCLDEQSEPINIVNDIWYEYVATCDDTLVVDTRGSSFDTMVAVYHDSVFPTQCTCPPGAGVTETCSDDIASTDITQTYLTMGVTAGDCYLIRIGGCEHGAENYGAGQMAVDCIPANDGRCCYPDPQSDDYLCTTTDETTCINVHEGCWSYLEEVAPGVYLSPISCLTTPCNCCKGDMDGNNSVNGLDSAGFVSALIDPPDCDTGEFCAADTNSDLVLDIEDVAGFVALLLAGSPCP